MLLCARARHGGEAEGRVRLIEGSVTELPLPRDSVASTHRQAGSPREECAITVWIDGPTGSSVPAVVWS
jgi:hypothetical protein